MQESFHLGRVRGIPVGVHWSVLIIGWLLAWGLADGVLPATAPGYSGSGYWFAAIATVVCFYVGLLAHEIGHSVVARRHGVEVDSITLWLFGGVSRLRGEAGDAGAELRIALIGPIVSLVVAAGFGLLALLLDVLPGLGLGAAAAAWLSFISVLLAVFNLAPAAPLDGGRVLHAIVWRRTGDRDHATDVATRAGRVFGWMLVGIGVVLLAAGDLAGVWFAVLGWFLMNAARAEATHMLLEAALTGVRVRDVMTPDPVVVPEDTPVGDLLDHLFHAHRCSAFPVVDPDGKVTGLVTLRRLRAREALERARVARDVAYPVAEVPTASPDEALWPVLERVAGGRGDGRLLVFDHDTIVGIVSPTDVNRAFEVAGLRSSGGGRPDRGVAVVDRSTRRD